ncbi:MAG: Fe2+-dependent dioxygenase [Spongiibacteraceae bacterium]|nr:Fe2+-dependent dioxygenase [Spongiibacteraceae bacterium]
MLLPIYEVLSVDDIAQCHTLLQQAQWEAGALTAGSQAAQVKSNLQLNDGSASAVAMRQLILKKLSTHPLFISSALPNKIFPPKFNCYQDEGFYGLHVDSALMNLVDGSYLRTDISATLFLNNSDDYEGGELTIETQYGAQSLKLNAGDLILYPSTSLHEVKPVTQGRRLCAFFWIQSMVQSVFCREQLFELDQSIQKLTLERGVSDSEVKRLSGVYHNLLREWAQV